MSNIVKYETDNGIVELTPEKVQRELLSGNAQLTAQEIAVFMELCKFQKLNPYLRECYIVKYGKSATIIVGKETFLKRATRSPDYDGYDIDVKTTDNGKPLSARCKVYRKSLSRPAADNEVFFSEYNQNNGMWKSKPITMLRKVALVQSLREAFPEELGGLYSEDEMPVDQTKLPREPVNTHVAPEMAPEPAKKQEGTQPLSDLQNAAEAAMDILDAEFVEYQSAESIISNIESEFGPEITDVIQSQIGPDLAALKYAYDVLRAKGVPNPDKAIAWCQWCVKKTKEV